MTYQMQVINVVRHLKGNKFAFWRKIVESNKQWVGQFSTSEKRSLFLALHLFCKEKLWKVFLSEAAVFGGYAAKICINQLFL